ncbi:MAG: preprotein translocase subunit SecE [Lachnospiraceae bacterium]|nr:preprotein translocase subunit SecE [Lachnospiraceae bacterium]
MGDSAKTDAPKVSFWKSVKTEFNKIAWPDKKECFKQSVAVLCVSIVLGFIITFMDTLIQYGINFITAL